MKINKIALFAIMLAASFTFGCGGGAESKPTAKAKPNQAAAAGPSKAVKQSSQQTPKDIFEQKRKQANIAEAASLVGYDGKKIKKDLNKIIDAQEANFKRLQDLNNQ